MTPTLNILQNIVVRCVFPSKVVGEFVLKVPLKFDYRKDARINLVDRFDLRAIAFHFSKRSTLQYRFLRN